MDGRKKTVVAILSVLVHLLLFLILNVGVEWRIIGINRLPLDPLKNEPIVFDLRQPEYPREVIETPDDARTIRNQKQADFLSDKNALARNPEADTELKTGDAFSRGDFETHELPETEQKRGNPQPPDSQKIREDQLAEIKKNLEKSKAGVFYRDYLFKDPDMKDTGRQNRPPAVKHDQRNARSLEKGGLSFNTYNWDFAPYLLMLKKRIQGNIYPPIAFTRLGMISGETLLRFRIYPNGELRNLKILGFRGDKSLIKTSHTAVEISAPFPELPPDFPEPFLEVTGRFLYFIGKPENRGEKKQ